ncbi:MAG TPA: hypothetical protein VMT69_07875 [Kineosporiaceae bacterium]|nr:hypothetical protein [Kineosporiaceae bacterium]
MTTATDDAWVVAVDVRGAQRLTATADARGVHVQLADADASGPLGDPAACNGGRPPLAVVVVHPATWDDAKVTGVLTEVARGAPAGWPAPVPLTAAEAAAWRALEFGLVPARGRIAVLDPLAREAAVVDRDGELLATVGPPVGLAPPPAAADESERVADLGDRLVALARRALDGAPPGPPFAGVLLAGGVPAGGADDAELPALVARVTGRAPLVPGDPAKVAVLGAASLGWAVTTTPADRFAGPPAGPAQQVHPLSSGRLSPPAGTPPGGPGHLPSGAVTGAAVGSSRRPRLWAAALVVLVAAVVVAGLGWHRVRTAPAPFTSTCPDGQVVAYSVECATLAPSATP